MITLQKHNTNSLLNSVKPKYIIAIGGSAGFLNPLIQFFKHTSNDDVSYIVLRHIGRDAKSELDKILQKHSVLKVSDAEDNIQVENNKVYILPTGFYMIIKNGRFHLKKRRSIINCAIDIFMESLAAEYKEKAIGIVLSGCGTNGTKGITSIKNVGGKVLVQQPSSCEFKYMPESAISTGCVDDIALAEKMPHIIAHYVNAHLKIT